MRMINLILWIVLFQPVLAAETAPFPRTWFYAGVNFQLKNGTSTFLENIRRAKAAGYNGAVLNDPHFGRPPSERPPHYWENLKRTRALAEELDFEIIPCIAPLSYSNGLLANDPNLAEGVPVKDCLFVVSNGKAKVANDANFMLGAGELEKFDPASRPAGWDFVDGPGKSIFPDREVKHSGASSVRMEKFRDGSPYGLSRLLKKIMLKPWHEYHVSAWIRTEGVAQPETIRIIMHAEVSKTPRFDLNLRPLNVRSTQDWTKHEFVFNTFDYSEVLFYIGAWDAEAGTIWIDELQLREVGGINLLRREGCPVRVTNEDGSQAYEEGRDFEYWQAPEMGRLPYPGIYRVHPEPPIVLTSGSRIREGQKLKVSFYHTQEILNGSVVQCLSHPRVFELYEEHVRQLLDVFPKTKTYLLKQDEVRLAGWCGLCNRSDQTAGNLLAEHVRRTANLIRRIQPEAELVIWSDMFDPHHNAVDRYWHTRGSMKDSWEGLDQAVIIGNWNQGKMKQSLKWFEQRGHRQVVATYYDRKNWEKVTSDWLDAAKDLDRIEGIIYTTWVDDYRDLEKFIELVRQHRRERVESRGSRD